MSAGFHVTLASGAARFLDLHAAELPQKDELCGAFCALLALRTANVAGALADQDAVAALAHTRITAGGEIEPLPPGEPGRRDYRVALETVADAALSGTAVGGLVRAVEGLSDGASVAIGLRGPWTAEAVLDLLELGARLERPVTTIANVATGELWGARSEPATWLRYLSTGTPEGPPPDWDVGHFVCLLGAVRGPAGTLVVVADTYPSLGWRGVHLQPIERVAAALERPGRAPGGVLVVVDVADAPEARRVAQAAGLAEGLWDNGTPG
jgi:Family of unknown function (DUF6885)